MTKLRGPPIFSGAALSNTVRWQNHSPLMRAMLAVPEKPQMRCLPREFGTTDLSQSTGMADMASLSLRRMRQSQALRELSRDVRVHQEQLVQPLFVVDGISDREQITGLHEVYRDTPASLIEQIAADLETGITKFLLFGVPAKKQSSAFDFSFTCEQIAAIKQRFGDSIWLAIDVCLCSYTTHGHCGLLNESGDQILNDPSVTETGERSTRICRGRRRLCCTKRHDGWPGCGNSQRTNR